MVTPVDREDVERDCIVIGGGLSGLVCANYIAQCGGSVLVLEARDRVGGRTCTGNITLADGSQTYADLGGAYVGPTQDRLLHLAHNLGIETFDVDVKGKHLLKSAALGRTVEFEGNDISALSKMSLLDLNNIVHLTNNLAKQISLPKPKSLYHGEKTINGMRDLQLQEPPLTAHEKELDRMSVQEFINKETHGKLAKEFYTSAIEGVLCCSPAEVSMLYWLRYCKAAGEGKMEELTDLVHAAQEKKFVGGSERISCRLRETLGRRVKLNTSVHRLDYRFSDRVTVETGGGTILTARYVVFAMAPSMYNRISFCPSLPMKRKSMANRMPMGKIIKTYTYFDRQWWKERGYSGILVDCKEGPVGLSFDDTKPNGKFPALMGFILCDEALTWSEATEEERKRAILNQYGKCFGDIEAAQQHFLGYLEKNWNVDEFSGGCYTGVASPGVLSTCSEVLRKPLGRLHFAGTETATYWTGYMEGAVQAGERAGYEVVWNLVSRDSRGRMTQESNAIEAADRFHFRYPEPDDVYCPDCPPPVYEASSFGGCEPHPDRISDTLSNWLPSPTTAKVASFLGACTLISFCMWQRYHRHWVASTAKGYWSQNIK
eukprot:gb/GECG01004306.1/.p1 GENE.gb/GECG01004306.1/~~gb/GECG01004306.1/.p1  ORF type:complete len:602 (+),score=58.41 gb/GECG01004306.1/:1-1806(+)